MSTDQISLQGNGPSGSPAGVADSAKSDRPFTPGVTPTGGLKQNQKMDPQLCAETHGMRNNPNLEHIRSMVRSVSAACGVLVQEIALLAEQLEPQSDSGARAGNALENLIGSRTVDAGALFSQLIIDTASKTITYRGRTCCLGNTLVFRMIERLARRPNHFVTFDRLVRDVWDGNAKSDEAIRSLVKQLRDRLRKNGMRKLASAIRSEKKAYVLTLKM